MAPVFTIDAEEWNDALHIPSDGHSSMSAYYWLVDILMEKRIHAIVYRLETFPSSCAQFEVKTHGRYHRWWENADRRPYQWLGFTGGFWFRFLPYWFVKGQIIKHGMTYFHPHDFDEEHPKLKNPFLNWKRHVGLKGAKKKLEKLLKEVQFA